MNTELAAGIFLGACIILVFGGAGLGLLYVAFQDLVVRLKYMPQMEKCEGRIIDVKQETRHSTDTNRRRRRDVTYMNFPVIELTRANGEKITFTTETGDLGMVSKYTVGGPVQVLYGPNGKLKPMLNTRGDKWSMTLAFAAGGIALLSGAATVAFLLWRNNFAQ